jgi:hypothetical protein
VQELTGKVYGARYYLSELSVWLSVDPLADKYPNESPYCYAGWNPVMITDPNGMWKKETDDDGNTTYTAQKGDSPGSLAKDAGISQSDAEDLMRDYNKSNNNNRSSDIMVYIDDQVTIMGSSSGDVDNEKSNEIKNTAETLNKTKEDLAINKNIMKTLISKRNDIEKKLETCRKTFSSAASGDYKSDDKTFAISFNFFVLKPIYDEKYNTNQKIDSVERVNNKLKHKKDSLINILSYLFNQE